MPSGKTEIILNDTSENIRRIVARVLLSPVAFDNKGHALMSCALSALPADAAQDIDKAGPGGMPGGKRS